MHVSVCLFANIFIDGKELQTSIVRVNQRVVHY